MESDTTQQASFAAKVDAFAQSLTPVEQTALMQLLGGDQDNDEVTGFGARPPWPGLGAIITPTRLSTSFFSAEQGSDEFHNAEQGSDEFADIGLGGTQI